MPSPKPTSRRRGTPRAELVIVANRLPVDRVTNPDGSTTWRSSPGGLVTALEPVMRQNHGAWIGWHGAADETVPAFEEHGLSLVPVPLTADEVEEYYEGFSNGTLWPLYHDVVAPPEFHREWWEAYVTVNRRFADKAAEVAEQGAVVWVQDYQLQLVPQMLRADRPDLRIGFFLHIPFPPTELFQQLPWRRQILEGLLGADLVGFQLRGGASNFIRLVRQHVGYKTHRDTVYLDNGRSVTAGAYPISIDAGALEHLAKGTRDGEASDRDPRRAGQSEEAPARRRPARLHQGSSAAAASLRRAPPRRPPRRRPGDVRPGGGTLS
jgi:trehalose 6-phosphate synthase